MEFVVILVVVVAVGALIYFNRSARSLDINQDGRVDAADAEMAIKNAAEGVKTTVKKAAVRAKTATRSAAKKPAAKKSSTKRSATKK
jgi:1,2-phenylacetyl-CoA epoxidase PaaB subunit